MNDTDVGAPRHALRPENVTLRRPRWAGRRRPESPGPMWTPARQPEASTVALQPAGPVVIDPFARFDRPPRPVWSPLPPSIRGAIRASLPATAVPFVPTQRSAVAEPPASTPPGVAATSEAERPVGRPDATPGAVPESALRHALAGLRSQGR